MNSIIYSPYATKAISEGRKRHMRFRAVNQGQIPSEPIYEDRWWYEALDSESTIPSDGRERIDLIKKAGLSIKGVIIAHEAPKLLCAPQKVEDKKTENDVSSDLSQAVQGILEVLGAILAVVGFILIAAIRIDPALIVVLDDGTWLEVMTWYD